MDNSLPEKATNYKVLIVDDIPENIQIIAMLLSQRSVEVSYANNGQKALDVVERIKPDLILLDIAMPLMDGFEVCQHLKASPTVKDIPIIFLTAKIQKEDVLKGLEMGAVDYVTKPFNNTELLSRVFTHIELKKSKDRLSEYIEIIDQQKQKLEEQNHRLEELNVLKDKIFSIIAHDLKNPFNSLIGFTELLIEDLYDYKYDEIHKIIKLVNDSATKGYSLLQNFLEWIKSQSGVLHWKPEFFDLQTLTEECISFQDSNAKNKEITITNEIPKSILVYADKNMVASIIRNLLSNAIKFTRLGGKIAILCANESDTVQIGVCDTGIGIEEDRLDCLFVLNTSYATAGTSGESGSGLGLLLCKDFVKMNGGKLWVESKVGEGSQFYFTIPKNKEGL